MHVQASGCLPWGSQDYDVENIRQYCILSPEGNVYHLIRLALSHCVVAGKQEYNRLLSWHSPSILRKMHDMEP